MGMDSRRAAPMGVGGNPGPKGLPLLARFSMARSTSVMVSAQLSCMCVCVYVFVHKCGVSCHGYVYRSGRQT
jgi:hypothetical protein